MTEHFTLVKGTTDFSCSMTPLECTQEHAEMVRDGEMTRYGSGLIYIHLLKHTPDGFVEIE